MDDWDWPQFVADIRQLCYWSHRIGDHWQLVGDCSGPDGCPEEGAAYLRYHLKHLGAATSGDLASSPDADSFLADEFDDQQLNQQPDPSACKSSKSTSAQILSYEYHILFHRSYRVPVLCFRASRANGTPLTLDEAWQLVAMNSSQSGDIPLAGMLTEMEHPLLFRPFLTAHPCRTAELLASMPRSANRVLTFVSTIGPTFNLRVNGAYGKLAEAEEKRAGGG